MNKITYATTVLLLTLVFSQRALAVVFLPPLLLIPIAKLVAIVLGGLALPTLGISTIFSKGNNKAIFKTVLSVLVILAIAGLLVALVLKIQNPLRPWF
jgi:hypothetical protein